MIKRTRLLAIIMTITVFLTAIFLNGCESAMRLAASHQKYTRYVEELEKQERDRIALQYWNEKHIRVVFGKKLKEIKIYTQGSVFPYESKVDDQDKIIMIAKVLINEELVYQGSAIIEPNYFKNIQKQDKENKQYLVGGLFPKIYKLPEKSVSNLTQPASDMRNWPKGNWQGECKDLISESTYSVSLIIGDYKKDEDCGSISYAAAQWNCAATLTCMGVEGSKYVFREKVESGECIDRGLIYLDKKDTRNLEWRWFYAGGIKGSEGNLNLVQ